MVKERAEHSREESVTYRRQVTRYYDLYRGFMRARSQPFRNQVHLPLLFSSIEAGIAIKHGLLFGQKPAVEFIPSGPEDAAAARRTTALVQQQFDDAHVEDKSAMLMRMGDIQGTGVFQWSWRTSKNLRPIRIPDPADPLGLASQVINQEIVDFDGPWWDIVDILDWYPAPGYIRVDEMPWCIRRYWMDLDDILALMQVGTFDAAAYAQIVDSQMGDETSTEFENRRAAPGGLRWTMPNVMTFDKYSKPVEILEMHGIIPNEMVPEDGMRNRLVTVANGLAVLRNVSNPIWAGGLPFGVYSPTPDPYSIYGVGKVEPNDKLQVTASRLASQKLDGIDFALDPMFAYNQDANVRTDKLYARPGGLIGGSGNPAEWLMPIHPPLEGLKQTMVEIEQLWRWMQHGTGITEEAIGMPQSGSDRQTAREFLGRMENVQRRMVREALSAGNQVLMPLAEAFRALDSQFLPFPKQLRMLGQNAVIDPVSGQPIPPDQAISLQDVLLRYDMRAASATSLIGRAAKQQNDVLLLQALGRTPAAMAVNWYAFMRKLFRDFEEPNPDEYVLPINPMQAMLMQGARVASGQPAPTSEQAAQQGGQMPGTPGQLNPDILNQVVEPPTQFPVGGAPTTGHVFSVS